MNPGDMNKMFDRIVADYAYKEKLKILSQPPSGPWIITLDEFLTPEECHKLIGLGGHRGYERSKDVGKEKFDGTYDSVESKSRTSSNAWCVDECYEDETTQNILSRIQNLTGVPEENYEYLQLLQYEETQFYGSHHGENIEPIYSTQENSCRLTVVVLCRLHRTPHRKITRRSYLDRVLVLERCRGRRRYKIH